MILDTRIYMVDVLVNYVKEHSNGWIKLKQEQNCSWVRVPLNHIVYLILFIFSSNDVVGIL